ncbi:hypothetical protein M1494_02230 [Candidatus Parvarchaeota archaeon]|nr:hypothetical protein [Candidatus Parvarchaeota archaeon]
MDISRDATNPSNPLQEEYVKKGLLYQQVDKFLGHAENAGYGFADLHSNKNKNGIELVLGNYKDNKEYYRINLSDIVYNDSEEIKNKKMIKGRVSIEKLIDYNEADGKYNKAQVLYTENVVGMTPRQYTRLFSKEYNLNKDENLPKIKNYNPKTVLLYSFAAAYGATVVSMVDNTALVNNAYYGFLHLGMLIAPYIPLQFSKKTRSIPQMFGLALVSWIANSLAYYPVGILMGHTADSLEGILNFYKFQVGLGKGSYVDNYGPLLRINSKTKALSYAGRAGLVGILSQADKILNKLKGGKKEVNNGKQ